MRNPGELLRILRGGIRRSGRVERNHRANSIWSSQRRGHAEIAALTMGEHDGSALDILKQCVIGALGRGVVASPTRNALSQEGVETPERET